MHEVTTFPVPASPVMTDSVDCVCLCFRSWAGLGDRSGQLGNNCFCNGSDGFIVSAAEITDNLCFSAIK